MKTIIALSVVAFLAAARVALGRHSEPCASLFLAAHRRVAHEGRVGRRIVLAQNCRQLQPVETFLAPGDAPAIIFCGDWLSRRDSVSDPFGTDTVIFLLIKNDVTEVLERMLKWLILSNNKALWSSNFIIWLHGNNTNVIQSVFEITWKYRLLKLIVADHQKDKEVDFFKVISPSAGVCEGNITPRAMVLGSCVKGRLHIDETKLKNNEVTDLQGCTLKISTIHFPPSVILFLEKSSIKGFMASASQQPKSQKISTVEPVGGIEVQIIRSLAARMNFSALFYLPPDGLGWGVGQDNGSFSGLLGELSSGRAEMGIGCIMPLPTRHKFLVMSRSYGYRGLAWAVPLPKLQPQWTVLADVFTPSTWTAVVTTLILAFLAVALFQNQSLTDGTFLYVWATVLGVSVVDMPRANWTRLLLLGWLLAFFVLSAAYQGALFSFMAKPRYQKAMDTFEDIVLNELPLIAHPNFNEFLNTVNPEITAKAKKLFWPTADNVLEQMEAMAKGGKEVACLVNREMLVWYNHENRHNGTTVHIAKEMATMFPTAVFLKRSSILTPRINKLIGRLVESGLVNKWYTDLTSEGSKATMDTPDVLGVDNFSGIFWALSIGLLASFLVFLMEIVVAAYNSINVIDIAL